MNINYNCGCCNCGNGCSGGIFTQLLNCLFGYPNSRSGRCGCYDAYYAAQYALNPCCCGCNSCYQPSGCGCSSNASANLGSSYVSYTVND